MAAPLCGVADVAQYDRVIARRMHRMGIAMKARQHAGQGRGPTGSLVPVKSRKIMTLVCEMQRDVGLFLGQDVNAELRGLRENIMPL